MLDLCAAPGGWLQVCRKEMPLTSLIVGVDLVAIRAIRGVRTIVEDITTASCRAAVKREAKGALFDAVLHDGAPNVGGNWSSEAYMQARLRPGCLLLSCLVAFARPLAFPTPIADARRRSPLLSI